MAGEWREGRLEDLCVLQRGHDLPRSEMEAGIYPVAGSNGVIGYHSKYTTKGPGVTIGRSGNIGTAYFYSGDFWAHNTVLYVKDFKGSYPRFVYYFLSQLDLGQFNAGSAVPTLNRNHIHSLPVRLPDISEQRAIAHILGTLDDKIELNRRMSATLEAMARALFKSWFVDFEPVRAKMEGRLPAPQSEATRQAGWRRGESLPGLPAHLYDLFPDRLVHSELGEIPEGWGVTALGELMELGYGKALKEENRRPGNVPVYGSNGQVGWHNEALITGPGIIVGRKGNPGTVTWVPTDFFAIDTTFYVVPKRKCPSLYFLFFALSAQDLPSLTADSAVPGLNRNFVYSNLQVIPLSPVLDTFDQAVRPLFHRRYLNDRESRTLAALRDALLPKLISGELRVKDAERFLRGVTPETNNNRRRI